MQFDSSQHILINVKSEIKIFKIHATKYDRKTGGDNPAASSIRPTKMTASPAILGAWGGSFKIRIPARAPSEMQYRAMKKPDARSSTQTRKGIPCSRVSRQIISEGESSRVHVMLANRKKAAEE